MPTPIIAFSKDWHEDPTSNHHVLRALARSRRVLWLNSLATRTPTLSSRDVGKIQRKLREFGDGPVNVENDLWVTTPLVLPLPHSRLATALNTRVLRATIRRLRARLGIEQFQLWTFLPTVAPYVGRLGESLAVYYCVDEWATLAGVDAGETARAEHALLAQVDIAFATSAALVAAKRGRCRNIHLARHGVDHAKFARALDAGLAIPGDLAALPRPRIGFFGTLRELVDLDAIALVARARPSWSIALVGQQLVDLGELRRLPNVHLLGQKPHDELPAYGKGFDVGLVPYRIADEARYINPLKLREYLAAGVPVVALRMPELGPLEHLCHVASAPAELVPAIERALAEDSPEARRRRSAAMASETWCARVLAVEALVDATEDAKLGARLAG